jgi:hypothetical protein
MSQGNVIFGTGACILMPVRDADGGLIAVPTPINMPSCTDFSIDGKFDTKMHEGREQYSVASAVIKRSIAVKFTNNKHTAQTLNAGDAESSVTGSKRVYADSTTAPFLIPTTPFTDAVVPPLSGTFVSDGGVFFGQTNGADAGKQLTRVASAPAAGQYTVSNLGVYVYAAADVGKPIYRNYVYNITTGQSTTIYNRDSGAGAEYGLIITSALYAGNIATYDIPRCNIKSVGTPYKHGDFMAAAYELEVMADPITGIVFTRSFSR